MPNFSFREQVVHHLPAQHSFRNNGVLEEGKKEVLHLMSISIFVIQKTTNQLKNSQSN